MAGMTWDVTVQTPSTLTITPPSWSSSDEGTSVGFVVDAGALFTVSHGGVSVDVARIAAKCDRQSGSVVVTSVDNELLVFGEQMSVYDTISVGDGGCGCCRRHIAHLMPHQR